MWGRETFVALLTMGLLLAVSVVPSQAQLVVNSGFASYGPNWGVPNVPLISTPILDLGTATSVAGASSGTAGNVVGASNATISSPSVSSTAVMTAPQMLFPGWLSSAAPTESASETSGGERRLDFGAAEFNDAYDFPSLGGRSLAEVATETRARVRAHANRVYTNDDILRLKQASSNNKS